MYYEMEFSKNEGNIKGTWKIINSNIKKQVKSKKVIIKEDDSLVDHKDVPYKFNDNFINIHNKLIK